MQIPEYMFKVEVQFADDICIGDYIIGTWNEITVETYAHAMRSGEVCALEFPLMTTEDLSRLTSNEFDELDGTSYILVSSVYRRRVPPPEVFGTVIDILEFVDTPGTLAIPQRAIWTSTQAWLTDMDTSVPTSRIQRWNLVAAAHKRD